MKRQSEIEEQDIILVLHAGTASGRQIAQDLLRTGHRVVVSDRYATTLTSILHGYSTNQVMAIAADANDPAQLRELYRRASARLGTISRVIDAADPGFSNVA